MTGRARTVGQIFAIGAVALLLGLLVWKLAFGSGGGAADELAKGKHPAAPAFELSRLEASGGKLSLADLEGKPVIVNFWASWCIPCKDEAPALQKTYEKYRAQGLTVLGIDAQDFRQDARRFTKRFGVTYPVVYDGSGSTLGKWGVTGFPETFFVDRSGPSRRRADSGRHRHRAQQGGLRQGHSGRTRPGAVIRLLAAGFVALALAGSALAGPATPRAAAAGRPRGGDRLPDLQDDARPVELSDRHPDEGIHPGADRRR